MTEGRTPLEVALQSGLSECARCGGTHEDALVWHQFKQPPGEGSGEYRYWATCPATGDPILLWCGPDEEVTGGTS